ncbi:MAG: hypothetical protein CTY28_09585 [Hyphomicrobium sp.]|nr:MAG: hypothetical protein CTY28_09585 [Hyphomicrobium sp.]
MTVNATKHDRVPDYAEGLALFRAPEAAAITEATTTDSVELGRLTRDSTATVGAAAVIALDVLAIDATSANFEVFASDTEGSGGSLVGQLSVRAVGPYTLSADLLAVNNLYPSGPVYLYLEATPVGGAETVQFGASLQKVLS